MNEDNQSNEGIQEDVSGANSSGSSSGSSSGGGSSSGSSGGGSSGSGASGARGVDSSGYTPGESKGARRYNPQVRYEEEYYPSGARRNRQQSGQQGNQSYQQGEQPTNGESSNNQNNNMFNKEFIPVPVGGFGGLGYGASPASAPAYAGLAATQAMQPVVDKSCEILLGQSDIRGEVKDAECSVKDSIMVSNSQRQTAELNLHNRLCESEKAAMTAGFNAVTTTKDAQNSLSHQIEMCCCDIKLQNVENRAHINEKFCETNTNIDNKFFAFERRMDKEFDAIRERECVAREAALTARVNELEIRENNGTLASSIINALKVK